jgi:hypothetical protein
MAVVPRSLSSSKFERGVAGVERSEPPVRRVFRGLAPLDPGHPIFAHTRLETAEPHYSKTGTDVDTSGVVHFDLPLSPKASPGEKHGNRSHVGYALA